MKRRHFLGAVAAGLGAPALIGLTRKAPRPIGGGFVDDGGAVGHRIRDRLRPPAPTRTERMPVVIVGAGIAGLSAAWELERRGHKEFAVLELEREGGGNARSGENEITAYPWAAHYVPVPDERATLVRELFTELGVLKDGVWEERYLCFSPQERLFLHGEWHPGLEPEYALDRRGREEFRRFDALVDEERATGQFTIPMIRGARPGDPLDTMSMATWLDAHALHSPALRWYVDYACRDDYGALARDVSAWAGVHYFASRAHDERGPLTWPEGNGWIAKRLIARFGDRVRTRSPVVRIERESGARATRGWRVVTPEMVYVADAVVFAAPTFLAPYLIEGLERWHPPFVYSPWFTANLVLERWPAERGRAGAPMAWDNVLYDSPGLGYVVATHQSLRAVPPRDERTVWTYYHALAASSPEAGRTALLRGSWKEFAEQILRDLERAHPDVRDCVSRIDVMRHGHAMVRPSVGFLGARQELAPLALPRLALAHSDLSGLSLFEEAQYRGVMATRAILRS